MQIPPNVLSKYDTFRSLLLHGSTTNLQEMCFRKYTKTLKMATMCHLRGAAMNVTIVAPV